MAVRADLHVELGLGRAGGELVATGAAHVRLDVLGMDACLHGPILVDGVRSFSQLLVPPSGGASAAAPCRVTGAAVAARQLAIAGVDGQEGLFDRTALSERSEGKAFDGLGGEAVE